MIAPLVFQAGSLAIEAISTATLAVCPEALRPEGPAFVTLFEAPAHVNEQGAALLASRMSQSNARVGLGVLQLANGQCYRPPHRIEDIRYCKPVATMVAVIARAHLRATIGAVMPSPDDPVLHWRLVREAAASGLVLTSDLTIGSLPPSAALAHSERIPVDLAGPRYEPCPRGDLILLYGEIDASISLYFDGLPPTSQARLRFLQPSAPVHDLPHLLAASLVVVVRGFEHLLVSGTLDLLDTMAVPYVWFVDDNILKLAEDQEGFAYYSPERVAGFAARTKGLIASTPALAKALAGYSRPVLPWPCILDSTLAVPPGLQQAQSGALVIGAVGGSFRRRSLTEHVLPALDQADPDRTMTLHGRFDLVHGLNDPWTRTVPMELSFRQFIHAWRELGCDILLHPAGEAANMPFKSPATLLVAHYLGAVPVTADEPAYAGLGRAEGVCVASPDPASWARHLGDLGDAGLRQDLLRRLEAWCLEQFAPEAASRRLETLAAWAEPGTLAERDRRLRRVLEGWVPPGSDLAGWDPGGTPRGPTAAHLEAPRPSLSQRLKWRVLIATRSLAVRTGTLGLIQWVRKKTFF